MVSTAVIDFTNVEEGGARFNKKRQPSGDYRGKILKVEDAPSKKDGINQWLYSIKVGSGVYPYYCKLQPNSFWKIRGLLRAAGLNVPSKRVKVDPEKPVGREIAVTLEDDEYNDKEQSAISSVFPVSELTDDTPTQSDDEEEVDEEEEDEEEEVATPPKSKKKAAPAAAAEVDDDELEELEVEDL